MKTFLQLKALIWLLVLATIPLTAKGQCINASAWGVANGPYALNVPVNATTCAFAGEYSTFNNLVGGNYYQVSSTAGYFITITTAANAVVAFGTTPVVFQAPSSGTYRAHLNTNPACGTNSICNTITIMHVLPPLPYTINAPANNATGVSPILSQLQITMNSGTATAGTGFLRIFRASDNVEVAAIDVASATIAGGTVTFPNSTVLECNTQYYVLIDNGAINDGGSFTGITSNTAWQFTTGAAPTGLVSTYGFQAISGGAGAYVQLGAGSNPITAIQADDATSGALPIGFTFFYENVPFTQFRASSNGFVSFNMALTSSFPLDDLSSNPVGGQRRPFVAPFWSDISGVGGTAAYQTTGVAPNRVCTIEFRNWRFSYAASSANISFQVKLYETTNVIEFIYRQETGAVSLLGTDGVSIGLGSGTNSVYLSLNNSSASPIASSTVSTTNITTRPATGQIYRFTPGPVGASIIALSPADNSVNVSPFTNLSITYNYPMQVGAGNITIQRVSDNSVVETIDVTSSQVVVNGNVITIYPSAPLPLNTHLYVNMPAGAFQSCNNLPSAAISGNSAWDFHTIPPDTNSQVETPGSQVPAGNMNIGGTKNVLNIGIRDFGTADGVPTVITGVTVNLSGGSISDLTTTLIGAQLRLNGAVIAATATINTGNIVFTIPPGNLSVADGTTGTLSVWVTALNNNALNGQTFSLDVSSVHGFTTDLFSSGLLPNTVGPVSGNLQTFVVPPPANNNGGGLTPPANPSNFVAVAQGTSSILLTWGSSSGASGYILYATEYPGGVEIQIANIPSGTTSFLHTNLPADTRFAYRLVAYNGGGLSTSVYTGEHTYPEAPEVTILSNACMNESGVIRAQGTHSSGKYRWYVSEDAVQPILGANGLPYEGSVYTTPSLSDATVFYVSAFGRKYESVRVAAPVTVKPSPVANLLGEPVRFSCENSVVLEAEAVQNATYTWLLDGNVVATTNLPFYEANRSGLYTLLVDLNGCDALSANRVRVTVNYRPIAEIIGGGNRTFCEVGSLSAREVPGASYEWLLNEAVVGTERTLPVSASGAYKVRVTQNGCVNESEVANITVNTFPQNIAVSISDSDICEGETAMLTTNNAGAGIRYEWLKDGRRFKVTDVNMVEVTEGGNYSVRLFYNNSTCGKVASSGASLFVNPVPLARLRQEGTELALRLQAPASSITWFFEGVEQPSFANQERITPTQSGSYKARVTYQSGCSIESNGARYVMITTGEEETPIAGFAIYPNPAREVLNVRLGQAFQNGKAQVQLLDVTGRSLYNQTVETEAFQISVADLALGSYVLQIQVGETLIVRQIVKE
jgi:hypothetical protein